MVSTDKMKIYIAGPITGRKNYMERFAAAEDYLESHGFGGRVINPAKISAGLPPESTSYKAYIDMGLSLLKECNAIYLLRGWCQSEGACLESLYARTVGYTIIREGDVL